MFRHSRVLSWVFNEWILWTVSVDAMCIPDRHRSFNTVGETEIEPQTNVKLYSETGKTPLLLFTSWLHSHCWWVNICWGARLCCAVYVQLPHQWHGQEACMWEGQGLQSRACCRYNAEPKSCGVWIWLVNSESSVACLLWYSKYCRYCVVYRWFVSEFRSWRLWVLIGWSRRLLLSAWSVAGM